MREHPAVEYLKEKLSNVKRQRGQYVARCPAHDDRVPSLGFLTGDKGTLVVYCRAGCSYRAIVEQAGLSASLLRKAAKVDRVHEYVGGDGVLSRCVWRFQGKKWAQSSLDASGELVWNVDGIPTILYKLPEVISAAKSGTQTIWVVEGERDADTLAAHGLVATTAPQGASFAWTAALVEPLRGAARVVIVTDCDAVGRKSAAQRHKLISKIVDDIRFLDLAPSRSDGHDVSDAMRVPGSLAKILALADSAPKIVPDDTAVRTFTKLYDDVVGRADMTVLEAVLYCAIVRNREVGRVDLSFQALATRFNVSRRAVVDSVQRLEKKGLIIAFHSSGGRQRTNHYVDVDPMPAIFDTVQKMHPLAQESAIDDASQNGAENALVECRIRTGGVQKLHSHNKDSIDSVELASMRKENEATAVEQGLDHEEMTQREIRCADCGQRLPWTDADGKVDCMRCDRPAWLNLAAENPEAAKLWMCSALGHAEG